MDLRLRSTVLLGVYTASNVALFGLLRQHYNSVCTSSWWSLWLTEPSVYCQLVSRALGILQWAPLVAAGYAVGPIAEVNLL